MEQTIHRRGSERVYREDTVDDKRVVDTPPGNAALETADLSVLYGTKKAVNDVTMKVPEK